MTQPWFKCYPRDFNDGMVGLTLEERGAYVTILNVIYARGGPIDDDPSYMRALLCCSAKTWVKIRASLIVKRKLFAVNLNGLDCLMNTRAAQEIADRDEKSQKFSDGGARGGRKTQAKLKENNGLDQAKLEPASTILDTDTDTEREIPAISYASVPEWQNMLEEAKVAAGDAADLTRPAMHHAADLRALTEPKSGEPCLWQEVLDAIAMVAMRQRSRGKPIQSWKWVQDDAWALRDKRLNANAPAVVDLAQHRSTGPPSSSFTAQRSAEQAEVRRRVMESENG